MMSTHATLRRVAVGATLMISLSAQAAPPVIEGKDGWLFAGWESGDKVDEATLGANIRLLQEAQTTLAARGVALLVLVVPAKAPFYPDRLPAGAISPPAPVGASLRRRAASSRGGTVTPPSAAAAYQASAWSRLRGRPAPVA